MKAHTEPARIPKCAPRMLLFCSNKSLLQPKLSSDKFQSISYVTNHNVHIYKQGPFPYHLIHLICYYIMILINNLLHAPPLGCFSVHGPEILPYVHMLDSRLQQTMFVFDHKNVNSGNSPVWRKETADLISSKCVTAFSRSFSFIFLKWNLRG